MSGFVSVAAGAALSVVFALSAAEKTRRLYQRSTSWHPLFLSGRRRRYSSQAIATSVAADLAVLVLVQVSPRTGGAMAALITVVYTLAAIAWLPVARGRPHSCECFLGGLADAHSRQSLLIRNAHLGFFAVLIAVFPATPTFRPSPLAAALLLLAYLHVVVRAIDAGAFRSPSAMVTAPDLDHKRPAASAAPNQAAPG